MCERMIFRRNREPKTKSVFSLSPLILLPVSSSSAHSSFISAIIRHAIFLPVPALGQFLLLIGLYWAGGSIHASEIYLWIPSSQHSTPLSATSPIFSTLSLFISPNPAA
ncbi:hypothetical protein L2E82_41414 [Cichorium intybus]|uniref:Uncharacterized protein n=1 Tax=Cichorium intybus TaxID=13427 RepID=A0ACB9AP18_CICIN|nr:hypothetical protein L2E82_41414 [Cichorium intybus]